MSANDAARCHLSLAHSHISYCSQRPIKIQMSPRRRMIAAKKQARRGGLFYREGVGTYARFLAASDCEFGVVDVPFGVVVAPLEVDPGVIVPLLLLVPVVSVELPVFEDCGTADPLAGTQSALAVLVVPGVVLELVEVVPALELLGEVLLLELGIELVELLGDVLLLELGDVLLLELGEVVLVELLGVEVVVLVVPVAFALVRGTIPAGQLLVEEALGLVEVVPVLADPLCEEDRIVELLPVVLPVCDELEGFVVVVVLVVEEVCAAAQLAHAVSTRII